MLGDDYRPGMLHAATRRERRKGGPSCGSGTMLSSGKAAHQRGEDSSQTDAKAISLVPMNGMPVLVRCALLIDWYRRQQAILVCRREETWNLGSRSRPFPSDGPEMERGLAAASMLVGRIQAACCPRARLAIPNARWRKARVSQASSAGPPIRPQNRLQLPYLTPSKDSPSVADIRLLEKVETRDMLDTHASSTRRRHRNAQELHPSVYPWPSKSSRSRHQRGIH